MPVARSVRDQARKFLAAGEEIRYAFPAQYVTGGGVSGGAHVIFVVTDASITVMYSGYFSRTRAKGVVARHSRATRLGPVEGVVPAIRVGGALYEVDDEYIPVINAVDAELDGTLPEDPNPGL